MLDMCMHKLVLARIANSAPTSLEIKTWYKIQCKFDLWTAIGVSSTSGTPLAFDVRGRSPHKRYCNVQALENLFQSRNNLFLYPYLSKSQKSVEHLVQSTSMFEFVENKPVMSGKNLNHDAKLTWIVKTLFLVQESSPLFKFSSAYRTVIATVCMSMVRRWKVCVTGSFPPLSLDKWLIPLNMAWKNSASHVKPSGDSQVFLKGPW